jgi:serine/threonine-protein kinase
MVMNYEGVPGPEVGVPSGTLIGGRFQIEAEIGAGGLGQLYRSLDLKTQKPIAIRILAADIAGDDGTLDRLREQVKAASALQHKNIASTYGMGKEGALRYIAFEFVEGQSLRMLLDKKRRSGRTFSLKGAYNVLAHVCNALSHAHQTIVHSLPGPGVTLINKVGRVKLCEFGLIRALAPGSEAVARLADSYCLAPEVATDPSAAGPSSDLYSLGVVLFELLTGRPPDQGFVPPSSLIAGLPQDVDEVLARCLDPDPFQRYTDAQQLKAAFYASVQSASEQAEVEGVLEASGAPAPAPAAAPTRRPSRPHPEQPASPAPSPQPIATGPIDVPAPTASQAARPQPAAPAKRQLTVEEHIAQARGDTLERWLVHKDRLDFGPFSLADLMVQISKGQFSGDDLVLDQETGERARIRMHALLRDFCAVAEHHLESKRQAQDEEVQHKQDKRRRTVIILTVTIGLVLLGAGGAVAAYFLTRKPQIQERLVYRDKKGQDLESLIKGIDITWKKEPEDQAARRRKYGVKRRGKAGPTSDDDVTYLGDANKEGGDALLTTAAVQRVMQTNFTKLTPCMYEELRRTPSLRQVNIDFGIRGSGKVDRVVVNSQQGGPFVSCILSRMQRIQFPKFDGTLTRASFSMSLK